MPDSLYGKYIAEREGKYIIERAEGFATYSFLPTGVYIENIYVLPEFRQSKIASTMADEIAQNAKKWGLSKMFGSVRPSAKGSTESLKVLLSYGMQLDSATNDAIFFVKEI